MYGTFSSAAVSNIAASANPPLTSLIMEAPAITAARAVEALIVSILIGLPASASFEITLMTRRSSSAAETLSAPGRVDSPPTSIRSAPSAISFNP